MNVLVTGATGYAGYHTAIALRQAGHSVYGLVHDADKPRAKTLEAQEVRVVAGDIREPKTYEHLIEQSDAIIHAMMDFESPMETDRKLFSTLREVSDRSRRNRVFVYTTGCSIYGYFPQSSQAAWMGAQPYWCHRRSRYLLRGLETRER